MTAHRAAFLRLLTVDGDTTDQRRKGYNQALFNADDGEPVWSSIDLVMVLDKYDRASKEVGL